MDRETLELVLPKSGIKVKYYSYFTAREMFSFSKAEDSKKTIITTLVVQLGDEADKEKMYETLLDLSADDFFYLDKALMKLIPSLEEKKT